MNPVELKRGRSFKGLAAYLLHDPKQETSERVGWTQSHNLNDADPDRAWRLMVSTAQSADALKEAAGEAKTGAKNSKPVYHFTLTWSATDQVNDQLQQRATREALEVLGFEKHQALAIQHTDSEHQHVHVMVNLINPDNGTTPKLSYTRKKLRKWADEFEQRHGLEITQGSRANAQKRQEGEKVDARRKPRNVYEQDKREGNDRRMTWLRKQEKGLAQTLQAENKALQTRHAAEWSAIKETYQTRTGALKSAKEADVKATIAEIKSRYKSKWAQTFKESRERLQKFDQSEKNGVAKLFNMGRTFVAARKEGADVAHSFLAASMKSERRLFVEKENQKRENALANQQKKEITAALEQVKRGHNVQINSSRKHYLEQCDQLKREQAQAKKEQRQKWRDYNQRRKGNFEKFNDKAQGNSQTQNRSQSHGLSRGRGRSFDPD